MTKERAPRPERRRVLVVDDEANTRLALQKALEPLGVDISLAATAREAVAALADPDVKVVLLDLELPDGNGLDVLRHIEANRPGVRVLIVTAHGTVDSAVSSMKLGALDVIQKPFSLKEIRTRVERELDQALQAAALEESYSTHVERARAKIRGHDFEGALEQLRRSTVAPEERPEALNLMGVLEQLRGNRTQAQRHWRMALLIDPTYGPAKENLRRSTAVPPQPGPLDLG